jgi:hypothetical protein
VACPATVDPATIGTELNGTAILIADILDPLLRRDYNVTGTVADALIYGDYLIATDANGIEIQHLRRSEDVVRLEFEDHQGEVSRGEALRRYGNLLLVSSARGIYAVDISEPLAPQIISAGNVEKVHQLAIFKDRLLAAAGSAGVRSFELPGALVLESSVDQGQLLANGTDLTVHFNEPVTLASLQQAGALSIERLDSEATVAVSVTSIDGEDESRTFNVEFTREPNIDYRLRVNHAANLRSGGIWLPFQVEFTAAAEGAQQPHIERVENGVRLRADDRAIDIFGRDFSATAEVRVNDLPVSYQRIDAGHIQIPSGAVDMLPLITGMHHLQVVDQGLTDYAFGALVLGDSFTGNIFSMTPDTAEIAGGNEITVRASQAVILPGTKVVLRSKTTGDQLESLKTAEGLYIVNLHDDVRTLNEFRFWLPGVIEPDVYEVFLRIGNEEQYVSDFSYRLPEGEVIGLPNYPPMSIGATFAQDELLYVGVASGSASTESNRFLMSAGIEIYDTSVTARPIRLSQLSTEGAVTGLALSDEILWAAAGSQGLLQVSVQDPTAPLLLRSEAVPGYSVTDVALNQRHSWLAMAAASDLGVGFVRMIDTRSDYLAPPAGVTPIAFADGEMAGRPLDVAWHGDALYVLLQTANELKLVVIDDIYAPQDAQVQGLGMSASANASLLVQHGRVLVSNNGELTVYQQDPSGVWLPSYWASVPAGSGELAMQNGALLVAGKDGPQTINLVGLAVTAVTPANTKVLGVGDQIRIQFSALINTSSAPASISLLDEDGNDISEFFAIDAINSLQGGVATITYASPTTVGSLSLQVSEQLLALNGRPLISAVEAEFGLSSDAALSIHQVTEQTSGSNFIHGDGDELLQVSGSGFGDDASVLAVYLGQTQLPQASITLVSDSELQLQPQALFLGSQAVALPLVIERTGQAAHLDGAVIVVSKLEILEINPHTGPPQGGNWLEIIGRGFHDGMTVAVGGKTAGDLTVLSVNRAKVRAPSGDFGYATVAVESAYFDNEVATSPRDYFYAGKAAGSAELSSDAPSPVSDMVQGDQLIYAVTGGSYDIEDKDGRRLKHLASSTARLVVVDTSDAVRPRVLEKTIAGSTYPFFHSVPGGFTATDGFTGLTRDGANLYAVGGGRLLHFDVTVPADPLYLGDVPINEVINGQAVEARTRAVVAKDNLIFVSSTQGIHVFQRDAFNKLRLLDQIDRTKLGGTPGKLFLEDDTLWFTMEIGRRVKAIELSSGHYRVTADIATADAAGNRFRPRDLLVVNDLLIVSTGERGSLVVFELDRVGGGQFAAEQPLTYLLRNGTVTAGALSLSAQTLYVAAGQGDLQLYDIAPWLANDFSQPVEMRHYFAVTGDVNALRVTGRALYAGSAFPYVKGEPAENPLDSAAGADQLGGGLSTIENDLLMITGQVPTAEATLAGDEHVTLIFNRLLDPLQFSADSPAAISVLLDGAPITGTVHHQVVGGTSQLRFVPVNDYQSGKRYQVRLLGTVHDLHQAQLGHDYRFRFVADSALRPHIETLSPVSGSWRGGNTLSIFGNGFSADTVLQLGEQTITSDQFITLNANEITFTAPAIETAPVENLPVAIAVSNGALTDRQLGAYTYITDPRIDVVGAWNPSTDTLNGSDIRFAYGESDWVAIDGAGFGPDTKVLVAGELAQSLTQVRYNRFAFRLPEDLIGNVEVSVSNRSDQQDKDVDSRLALEFVASPQLKGKHSKREGDLLLFFGDKGWSLHSTAAGGLPQLLSVMSMEGVLSAGEKPIDVALQGDKVAVLTSLKQLFVYSISNPLNPLLQHQWVNSDGLNIETIDISGNALALRGGDKLWLGNLSPVEIMPVPVTGLQAALLDQHGVYLLTDQAVEFRSFAEPTQTQSSFAYLSVAPTGFALRDQRLLLTSQNEVEVIDARRLRAGDPLAGAGILSVPGVFSADLNGELLAVLSKTAGITKASIVDVGPHGGNYVMASRHVADVRGTVSADATVRFNGAQFEWQSGDTLYAATLPIDNFWKLLPVRINGSGQEVIARYSGAGDAWRNVMLDVMPASTGVPIAGYNQQVGDQIRFRVFSDTYVQGEGYNVALGASPSTSVRGAEVQFDMPWYIDAAPLFGFDNASLDVLTPSSTITDRAETFTLIGQRLDAVTALSINGQTFTAADWTVADDATSLSFAATFSQPGIVSVIATLGNGEQVVLPAALVVTQSVAINSVVSAKANGNEVSDTTSTSITISGAGFDGDIAVHLLRVDKQQQLLNSSNIAASRVDSSTLRIQSSGGEPGERLQVVVVRGSTNEQVYAEESQWLTVVDDTAPVIEKVLSPSYLEPMQIIANEPITVSGFQVVQEYLDYSGVDEADISAQFELVQISPAVWHVRNANNIALNHNAHYRFRMTGVSDAAGNLVAAKFYGSVQSPAGEVPATFLSTDTLPPRNLQITAIRADGRAISAPLNLATQLTRGRQYEFVVSGEDNYDSNVRYQYRLASDYPENYGRERSVGWNDDALESRFTLNVTEAFQLADVRLIARDKAGNELQQRFQAGLRDPAINFDGLSTDPAEPEESVSATLHYVLSGDVDMLDSAVLHVTDMLTAAPIDVLTSMMISADGTQRSGSTRFLNPKIKDVAEGLEGAESIQIPVYLHTTFGFTGQRTFETAYTLYKDRTPPTLSIVSPQEGDFIAFDERTDIIIQAFDKYGIETVEVSRDGGAWETLADIRRYSFTVSKDDYAEGVAPQVNVQVRATDPNGNSTTRSVSLRAYDPSEGAPQVSILSPRNGAAFYENEQTTFEVALQRVTSAKLCFDIGGIPADDADCINVTRSPEADDRVLVPVQLPPTGEDIVVLARLQSGTLKSYVFLNVRADDGLTETPLVSLTPNDVVLAGTGVAIIADVPSNMPDFSDSSAVALRDPQGQPPLLLPMRGLNALQPLSAIGDAVDIEALLRDRSGNETNTLTTLTKQPYFTGAQHVLWQAATSDEQVVGAVWTPSGIVWAVNSETGAALHDESGVLWSATNVALEKIAFSGTALLAEVTEGQQQSTYRWQRGESQWQAPVVRALPGNAIAVQGDRAWRQLGATIQSWHFSQGDWIDSAGLTIAEPVKATATVGDALLLLTASGLQVLDVDTSGVPKVHRVALFARADAQGMTATTDRIYVWQDNALDVLSLNAAGELAALHSVEVTGNIDDVMATDDDIIRVTATQANQTQWWWFENDALRGIQRAQHDIAKLVPGAMLSWSSTSENSALIEQVIDRQHGSYAPLVSATATVAGVEITLSGTDGRYVEAAFTDGTRAVVAQRISRDSWIIGWDALQGAAVLNVQLHQHGRIDSVNTSLPSFVANAMVVNVIPSNGDTVAQGATVPLNVALDASARVRSGVVTDGSQPGPMASADGGLWRWQSPSLTESSATHRVELDGNAMPLQAWTLIAPDNTDISVILSTPQNNALFTAGDEMAIRFSARDQQARAFRFAQVSLIDFNGNTVQQSRVASQDVNLTWQAPAVSQREVFTLRVRSYFGDSWQYKDTDIGVTVIPQRLISQPVLNTSPVVYSGAEISLALQEPLPSGITRVLVRDEANNIVASGSTQVTLTVPDTQALSIEASADNGQGAIQNVTSAVTVLPGYQWASLNSYSADIVLPDVDNTWLVSDRDLLDANGEVQRRFNAPISDVIRLGDRLLVALQDTSIEVIDPEENFASAGTLPITGTLTNLTRYGDLLLAQAAGEPRAFRVSGNAVTPELSLQAALRDALAGEQVIDWILESDDLVLLTSNGLSRWTLTATDIAAVTPLYGVDNGADLLRLPHGYLVSTDEGALIRIDARGARRVDFDLHGTQMTLVGDDVLISEPANGTIAVIESAQVGELFLMGRYPLAQINDTLVTQGNRLWTGGVVYQWQRDNAPQLMLSAATLDTTVDIAAENGEFLLAGSIAGASRMSLESKGWALNQIGQPFSLTIDHVVADSAYEYMLAADTGTVQVIDRVSRDVVKALSFGQNRRPQQLALTPRYVVAAAGDTLLLRDKQDLSKQSEYTPIPGDNIVSLTTQGESIYFATASHRIQRVSGLAVPMVSHKVRRARLLDSAAANGISSLKTDGNYLYFIVDTELHRMDLTSLADVVAEASLGAVDALAVGNGRVWAALRDGSSNNIVALDPETLAVLSQGDLSMPARVRAMAVEGQMLAVAMNGGAVRLYQVGEGSASGEAAVGMPTPGFSYQQGERIALSLNESFGIDSVRYLINGRVVSASAQAPFADEIAVPGFLRNGQPFDIEVEASRQDGSVSTSVVRRVLLQGEELPANDFRVVITEPTGVSHMPKPLSVRAEVLNSNLPIEQVEFYLSETTDSAGAYQIDGKHYGPQYIIHRDYDDSYNGRWFKVRAIDMFGNTTESVPTRIERVRDEGLPQITAFSVDEPYVEVSPGRVVEKHAFTLRVNVSDAQSGIESALLRRNGTIVAAAFADGDLTFNERTALAGEVFNYTLEASDRAGNTNNASVSYTVVQDTLPVPSFAVMPDSIVEQAPFIISASASDDVAVRSLRVRWEGFDVASAAYTGFENVVAPLTANGRDRRANRIGNTITGVMSAEAIDDIGQVGRLDQTVSVVVDQAPDISLANVSHHAADFYGNAFKVTLTNLTAVDEALDPATVSVINADTNTVLASHVLASGEASKNLNWRLPEENVSGDTFNFKLRYVDHLGQQSDGVVRSLQLSRMPNALRFNDEDGASNPRLFQAGTAARYRVDVLDDAERPVALQTVRWTLTASESGNVVEQTDISSGLDGAAVWTPNTGLKLGRYVVTAELIDFKYVAKASLAMRVLAGEMTSVTLSHVPLMEAGEQLALSIIATDAGGNAAVVHGDGSFTMSLPYNGFHFGFINDAAVQNLSAGQEVTLALKSAAYSLPIRMTTLAGLYSASAIASVGGTPVPVLYDHDGLTTTAAVPRNSLPIQVVAAAPYRLAMTLESFTNRWLAEESVLEARERATVALTVEDVYSNRVYDYAGAPVDASVNLSVDGEAVIGVSGDANALVNVLAGATDIIVTSDVAETVSLSVTNIQGVDGLQVEPLSLEFRKQRPVIVESEFDKAINNSDDTVLRLKLSEEVIAVDQNVGISAQLNGEDIAGTWQLETVQVNELNTRFYLVFTAEQPLPLNQCVAIDTSATTLVGAAESDAMLAQQFNVCMAAAKIVVPEALYGFENEILTLGMIAADGLDVGAISTAYLRPRFNDEILTSQSLDVLSPSFTLPSLEGVVDGALLSVFPTALYGGEELIEAFKVPDLYHPDYAAGWGETVESYFFANRLEIQVLSRNGDYDGDGLSNELEDASNGISPLLADTDGNGIDDGAEDLDGDGLSNAEEIVAGSSLTIADTDGDGLSDGDEVNLYQTSPTSTDSDGDNISDFIEALSGGSPNDPAIRFIDPFFVTAMELTPTSMTADLILDGEQITPALTLTFEANGYTDTVDGVHLDWVELFFITSSDANVVVANALGGHAVGLGEASLRISLLENPMVFADMNISVFVPSQRDFDNDGVPDYVELVSGSDPRDSQDTLIDPQYISALVAPESIELTLAQSPYTLPLTATFTHAGNDIAVQGAALADIVVASSSDEEIVQASSINLSLLQSGEVDVSFVLIGNSTVAVQTHVVVSGELREFDLSVASHPAQAVYRGAEYGEIALHLTGMIDDLSDFDVYINGMPILNRAWNGECTEELCDDRYFVEWRDFTDFVLTMPHGVPTDMPTSMTVLLRAYVNDVPTTYEFEVALPVYESSPAEIAVQNLGQATFHDGQVVPHDYVVQSAAHNSVRLTYLLDGQPLPWNGATIMAANETPVTRVSSLPPAGTPWRLRPEKGFSGEYLPQAFVFSVDAGGFLPGPVGLAIQNWQQWNEDISVSMSVVNLSTNEVKAWSSTGIRPQPLFDGCEAEGSACGYLADGNYALLVEFDAPNDVNIAQPAVATLQLLYDTEVMHPVAGQAEVNFAHTQDVEGSYHMRSESPLVLREWMNGRDLAIAYEEFRAKGLPPLTGVIEIGTITVTPPSANDCGALSVTQTNSALPVLGDSVNIRNPLWNDSNEDLLAIGNIESSLFEWSRYSANYERTYTRGNVWTLRVSTDSVSDVRFIDPIQAEEDQPIRFAGAAGLFHVEVDRSFAEIERQTNSSSALGLRVTCDGVDYDVNLTLPQALQSSAPPVIHNVTVKGQGTSGHGDVYDVEVTDPDGDLSAIVILQRNSEGDANFSGQLDFTRRFDDENAYVVARSHFGGRYTVGTWNDVDAIEAIVVAYDGAGNASVYSVALRELMDTDGDGLYDFEEEEVGSNPAIADTDKDGVNDYIEVRLGYDPLDGDDERPYLYEIMQEATDYQLEHAPGGLISVRLGVDDAKVKMPGITMMLAGRQTHLSVFDLADAEHVNISGNAVAIAALEGNETRTPLLAALGEPGIYAMFPGTSEVGMYFNDEYISVSVEVSRISGIPSPSIALLGEPGQSFSLYESAGFKSGSFLPVHIEGLFDTVVVTVEDSASGIYYAEDEQVCLYCQREFNGDDAAFSYNEGQGVGYLDSLTLQAGTTYDLNITVFSRQYGAFNLTSSENVVPRPAPVAAFSGLFDQSTTVLSLTAGDVLELPIPESVFGEIEMEMESEVLREDNRFRIPLPLDRSGFFRFPYVTSTSREVEYRRFYYDGTGDGTSPAFYVDISNSESLSGVILRANNAASGFSQVDIVEEASIELQGNVEGNQRYAVTLPGQAGEYFLAFGINGYEFTLSTAEASAGSYSCTYCPFNAYMSFVTADNGVVTPSILPWRHYEQNDVSMLSSMIWGMQDPASGQTYHYNEHDQRAWRVTEADDGITNLTVVISDGREEVDRVTAEQVAVSAAPSCNISGVSVSYPRGHGVGDTALVRLENEGDFELPPVVDYASAFVSEVFTAPRLDEFDEFYDPISDDWIMDVVGQYNLISYLETDVFRDNAYASLRVESTDNVWLTLLNPDGSGDALDAAEFYSPDGVNFYLLEPGTAVAGWGGYRSALSTTEMRARNLLDASDNLHVRVTSACGDEQVYTLPIAPLNTNVDVDVRLLGPNKTYIAQSNGLLSLEVKDEDGDFYMAAAATVIDDELVVLGENMPHFVGYHFEGWGVSNENDHCTGTVYPYMKSTDWTSRQMVISLSMIAEPGTYPLYLMTVDTAGRYKVIESTMNVVAAPVLESGANWGVAPYEHLKAECRIEAY